jgi:predicted  nucleic acid-binding Zn-ribbon protein
MERRWDPHTCAGCGVAFDVGYDEELEGSPDALVEVACPACGRPKPISVPEGAAADLVVEAAEADAEEGEGD